MRRFRWALAVLVGSLALAVVASAQVAATKKPPRSFNADLAAEAKVKEEVIERVIKAIGPVVRAQLRAGRQVDIPGVGSLQIIQIGEHRELVDGRPGTIAARNIVEFVGTPETEAAANAPGVVPARVIEGYEFRINPRSNPGIRTDTVRTPDMRVPNNR